MHTHIHTHTHTVRHNVGCKQKKKKKKKKKRRRTGAGRSGTASCVRSIFGGVVGNFLMLSNSFAHFWSREKFEFECVEKRVRVSFVCAVRA